MTSRIDRGGYLPHTSPQKLICHFEKGNLKVDTERLDYKPFGYQFEYSSDGALFLSMIDYDGLEDSVLEDLVKQAATNTGYNVVPLPTPAYLGKIGVGVYTYEPHRDHGKFWREFYRLKDEALEAIANAGDDDQLNSQ